MEIVEEDLIDDKICSKGNNKAVRGVLIEIIDFVAVGSVELNVEVMLVRLLNRLEVKIYKLRLVLLVSLEAKAIKF